MKIITIAGTVGKDAELRRTQSGDPVCNFSVAVSDRKKETTWFDVSIWGKRADALSPHINKGGKITVCGDFQTREHNGKTYLQVSATDVALQGGKRGDDQGQSHQEPQQSYGEASGGNPDGGSMVSDLNDDIPFAPETRG